MKRLLCVLPFLLISCEKEVISPNKYLAAINSGKSAVVVKSEKKPFKLRLRKRKRKHGKVNKITVDARNRIYKYSSSSYNGNGDSSIRTTRYATNSND